MKKRIGRAASVLLSLPLLLSLAACGEKDSGQQQESSVEQPEDSGQAGTDSRLSDNHTSKEDKGESNTPPVSPAQTDNEQAQTGLELLRECMENEPQIALAAACLGYREADDPTPLTDWLWVNSPGLMEEMPFILTIPVNGSSQVMTGGCRPQTRDLRTANGVVERIGIWSSAEATAILTIRVLLTCITGLRTDRSISCSILAFGEWRVTVCVWNSQRG